MPLLQFDTTADATDKEGFADAITAHYAEEMQTGTGHIAVAVRERTPDELHLGREVPGPLLFLDAEIRQGRPFERKRAFALAAMDEARDRWDIPEPNMKAVFTEHEGEQMMGYERVGGEWSAEESE